MATVKTLYHGDFRTEAEHLQSGSKIVTDAPTDNNGKGEAFSPTDLVAASLGSCMLTIMDMAAQRLGIDLRGTRIETTKVMASDPRRIAEIIVEFHFPTGEYSAKDKAILERAGDTCPVSKSLHPDLKQTIRYYYGD